MNLYKEQIQYLLENNSIEVLKELLTDKDYFNIVVMDFMSKCVKAKWILNDDGTVSVIGNLKLLDKYRYEMLISEFPIQFKRVSGDFDFSHVNLVSLKGSPSIVGGICNYSFNPNIKTLEGAPFKVGKSFVCHDCENLESLLGGPKSVGADYLVYKNSKLKSLEGSPSEVPGMYSCSECRSLKFLRGVSEKVGQFHCRYNEGLVDLKGGPKFVEGDYDCRYCLIGFTESQVREESHVKGNVYCNYDWK